MNRHRTQVNGFACAAIALLVSPTLLAQNFQSYVSAAGRDSNDCTVTAPCRSINRALAVTLGGGEVAIVSSGTYASATITQPVTLSAVGVNATIFTKGDDGVGLAIDVEAGDVVVKGLSFNGRLGGSAAITTTTQNTTPPEVFFHLSLDDVRVQGYEYGVRFETPDGRLTVHNSHFTSVGGFGLLVQGQGAAAYVDGSAFDRNFVGIQNDAGTLMTVSNSSITDSNTEGASTGGTMILYKSRIVGNLNGLLAEGTGAKLYFADCLISGNESAWATAFGGAISGTSPGTTFVAPGQVENGSLRPAVDLK